MAHLAVRTAIEHSRARWRPGGGQLPYGTPVLVARIRRCHGVVSQNLARVCYNLRPMAPLHRIRIGWSGSGVVGPGVSTFFVDPAVMEVSPAAFKNFFTSIASYFSPNVTWTIPNTGDSIEETTGHLLGSWSATGGGTVSGSNAGALFVEGVGMRVVWKADTVRPSQNPAKGPRRMRGSTFLVPCRGDLFKADGLLDPNVAAPVTTAAAALRDAHGGALAIWGRPSKGGSNGMHGPITQVEVPRVPSWLRTRKV